VSRSLVQAAVAASVCLGAFAPLAAAQSTPPANTTVVPRSPTTLAPGDEAGQITISLSASLTDDSQPIVQGLVWRIYRDKPGTGGAPVLVSTQRTPNPRLRLEPGDYMINVAYGRANLTRRVSVTSQPVEERFVLNAGGLRVIPVLANGRPAADQPVSFDVQSDERDQYGQRTNIVTGAKPGVVLRLNSGIYNIVSTYGDANAVGRADISVEAGKLTEVTLVHLAAEVSFKLVTRRGGDAISDTQWNIASANGDTVRDSAGALPRHFLAPGGYIVTARHAGRTFRRDFAVKAGDIANIEVVMP
jgi:hypothetical protein